MHIWIFPSDDTVYAQTIIWTQTTTFCNSGCDLRNKKKILDVTWGIKRKLLIIISFSKVALCLFSTVEAGVRMAARITLRIVWLEVEDFPFLHFCIFVICYNWGFPIFEILYLCHLLLLRISIFLHFAFLLSVTIEEFWFKIFCICVTCHYQGFHLFLLRHFSQNFAFCHLSKRFPPSSICPPGRSQVTRALVTHQ